MNAGHIRFESGVVYTPAGILSVMKALASLAACLLVSLGMATPQPPTRPVAKDRVDVISLIDTIYCGGYPRCRGLFADSVYVMADQECALVVRGRTSPASKLCYRVLPYGNPLKTVRPGHPYTLVLLQTLKKEQNQLVVRLSLTAYTGGPPHPKMGNIGVDLGEVQVRLRRVKHLYIYQAMER